MPSLSPRPAFLLLEFRWLEAHGTQGGQRQTLFTEQNLSCRGCA